MSPTGRARRSLDPSVTALLLTEVQVGVVGDLAVLPRLADSASEGGIRDAWVRLVHAARAADVLIVHATVAHRPGFVGSPMNAPLFEMSRRYSPPIISGTPSAAPLPELGVPGAAPREVVCERHGGVSPFFATDLDQFMRAHGIRSVVIAGASVNVGVLAACIDAVNLGYRAIVPRDAIVGLPSEYVEHVVDNTLSALAEILAVDELVACLTR